MGHNMENRSWESRVGDIDTALSAAPKYAALRQLPITNLLTKWIPNASDENRVTHTVQASIQDLSIRCLADPSEALKIGVGTYKLLDALTAIFTANGTRACF